jgi:hypothetical protein
MTQLGGSSSAFEPLLLAQRFLVFQEQSQPFVVFEAARFGLGIEEPLAIPWRPRLCSRSRVGWVSMLDNPFKQSRLGERSF